MNLGRAVQIMRAARNTTQGQLADAIGVNRVWIWQIESEQMRPAPDIEAKIKAALRWTPPYR